MWLHLSCEALQAATLTQIYTPNTDVVFPHALNMPEPVVQMCLRAPAAYVGNVTVLGSAAWTTTALDTRHDQRTSVAVPTLSMTALPSTRVAWALFRH